MSILAVLEQRDGVWNRMSFEALAAAQQFGAELGLPVFAAVIGNNTAELTGQATGRHLHRRAPVC